MDVPHRAHPPRRNRIRSSSEAGSAEGRTASVASHQTVK
ncbi:hypothetical protein GZL_00387 [Streptomyces sp. 769]|nr:hypothetical protein GZL_00387 [Streptomyces sp. 769]